MQNAKGSTSSMTNDEIIAIAETLIYKAKADNKPDMATGIQRALNGLTYAKESGCEASVDFAIELIESEIQDYKEVNRFETK